MNSQILVRPMDVKMLSAGTENWISHNHVMHTSKPIRVKFNFNMSQNGYFSLGKIFLEKKVSTPFEHVKQKKKRHKKSTNYQWLIWNIWSNTLNLGFKTDMTTISIIETVTESCYSDIGSLSIITRLLSVIDQLFSVLFYYFTIRRYIFIVIVAFAEGLIYLLKTYQFIFCLEKKLKY